jgi:short-subunit dehydrogenase
MTNPPGDAAYNVSKAGVRSVTESLAHELREIDGCEVTAHLLVPGFTYTGLTKKRLPQKPAAAWLPEQVAEELLKRMGAGDFYVLCPDNDVTVAMDHARLQWNTGDVIENRPALSRWHADYAVQFAAHMQGVD